MDTEHDEESALCPGDSNVKIKDDENKPWQTLVSYVDELTVGGRRNSKGQYIDGMGSFPGFGKYKPPKVPPDCFPSEFYQRCPCFDKLSSSNIGKKWMELRSSVLAIVDTPSFEWFILVLIFASSVTLCFEDIHIFDHFYP